MYEGDYHVGVAALANSLHKGGFRGTIWIGGRGHRPHWLATAQRSGDDDYDFSGMRLRFIDLDTPIFLSHYKPKLMLDIFRRIDPTATALMYFDPDIVCQASWRFFGDWIDRGIALVEDACYARFPCDHPLRLQWKDFMTAGGDLPQRDLDTYYNGGFLGVSRKWIAFLELWQRLLDRTVELGATVNSLKSHIREEPFAVADQDTLNMACMGTGYPLSTVGQDGMGFAPAGFIMQHAVDNPKPWRRRYLAGLFARGQRHSLAHSAFWQNIYGPIVPFPPMRRRLRRFDLKVATALGRFYRA